MLQTDLLLCTGNSITISEIQTKTTYQYRQLFHQRKNGYIFMYFTLCRCTHSCADVLPAQCGLPPTTPAPKCPDKWWQVPSTNRCWRIFPPQEFPFGAMKYEDAKKLCQNEGATLADVKNTPVERGYVRDGFI